MSWFPGFEQCSQYLCTLINVKVSFDSLCTAALSPQKNRGRSVCDLPLINHLGKSDYIVLVPDRCLVGTIQPLATRVVVNVVFSGLTVLKRYW